MDMEFVTKAQGWLLHRVDSTPGLCHDCVKNMGVAESQVRDCSAQKGGRWDRGLGDWGIGGLGTNAMADGESRAALLFFRSSGRIRRAYRFGLRYIYDHDDDIMKVHDQIEMASIPFRVSHLMDLIPSRINHHGYPAQVCSQRLGVFRHYSPTASTIHSTQPLRLRLRTPPHPPPTNERVRGREGGQGLVLPEDGAESVKVKGTLYRVSGTRVACDRDRDENYSDRSR